LLPVPFGLGSIKGILGVYVLGVLFSKLGAVVTAPCTKVARIGQRVISGRGSIPHPSSSVPIKARLKGRDKHFISRAVFHRIPRSLP
jgi:hypothetical protein